MTQEKTKVLVIGDGCQDVFRYGRCSRLSPEAPVPILLPSRTIGNGGMAINVMENLKALGVDCDIITNDVRPTKMRFVDEVSNQMLLRVDEKDEIYPIDEEVLKNIKFDKYRAIVISDYNKGYLSEEDIQYIAENHPLTFMDTKKKFGEWMEKIKFIKINEKEFNENGEWLTKYYEGNLIVTLGSRGAKLWFSEIPIEKEHDVRDLSGAGDTFLAALVADFIKNNDIRRAISFANKCASWVVTQRGVVVVDLNKIEL